MNLGTASSSSVSLSGLPSSVCATGDLSGFGKLFRVSLSQFERDLLPLLTARDCVLCVQGKEASPQLQALMDR